MSIIIWIVVIIALIVFVYIKFFRKQHKGKDDEVKKIIRMRADIILRGGLDYAPELTIPEPENEMIRITSKTLLDFYLKIAAMHTSTTKLPLSVRQAASDELVKSGSIVGVRELQYEYPLVVELLPHMKTAYDFLLTLYGKEIEHKPTKASRATNVTIPILEFASVMFNHKHGTIPVYERVLGTGGFNIACKVNYGGKSYCLRCMQSVDRKPGTVARLIGGFHRTLERLYDKEGEMYKPKIDTLPPIFMSSLDFVPKAKSLRHFFLVEPIYEPIVLSNAICTTFVNDYIKLIVSTAIFLCQNKIFYFDYKVSNVMMDKDTKKLILTDIDFLVVGRNNVFAGDMAMTYKNLNDVFFEKKIEYITPDKKRLILSGVILKSFLALICDIVNIIKYNHEHVEDSFNNDDEFVYKASYGEYQYGGIVSEILNNFSADDAVRVLNSMRGFKLSEENEKLIRTLVNVFNEASENTLARFLRACKPKSIHREITPETPEEEDWGDWPCDEEECWGDDPIITISETKPNSSNNAEEDVKDPSNTPLEI